MVGLGLTFVGVDKNKAYLHKTYQFNGKSDILAKDTLARDTMARETVWSVSLWLVTLLPVKLWLDTL